MKETNSENSVPEVEEPIAESLAESDGVSVEKQVRWLDEDTLRVEFGIESSRDEPVNLRLEESIPSTISLDDVGFHGEYGWQNWYVEHDTLIRHEVELEPNEDLLTLYGVKLDSEADPTLFDTRPEVIVSRVELDEGSEETSSQIGGDDTETEEDGIETPSTDESPRSGEATQSATESEAPSAVLDGGTEDVDSGSSEVSVSDSQPSTAGDTSMFKESDGEDEAPEGRHRGEDDEQRRSATKPEAGNGDLSRDDGSYLDDPESGFVAALVAELEAGTASESDLEKLQSHLGEESAGPSTSYDVRLRRVEQDVNEVAAYTDALEEFLDENGTGRELLDSLTVRADELEEKITSVQQTVDTVEDRLESVEARGERLDELGDRIDELSDAFEDVSELADANDDNLERLSERLETVENRYGSETDSLENEIEEMASELEHIKEWQEQYVRTLEDFTRFATEDNDEAGKVSGDDRREADSDSVI